MLYDRKIKYLDYYENGVRVRGGGFAKIEIREDSMRMELNLTGLHPTDSFDREVMLLDGRKEKVLGNMAIVGGKGQYLHLCHDLKNIGGTGINYGELRGIRIPLGAGREISCVLQPQSPTAEKKRSKSANDSDKMIPFRTGDEKGGESGLEEGFPGGVKESGTRRTESMKREWEEGRNPGHEPEVRQQTGTIEWREDKEGQNGQGDHVRAERQNEPEKGKGELQKEWEGKPKAELRSEPEEWRGESREERQSARSESREMMREAEIPELTGASRHGGKRENEKPIMQKEDKWAQLWSIYPHIHPFQDEREYLSIRPSDFVLFPEASYRMVNNSFLLHGYYNYHHLLLNRVEKRGEVLYYIGVPGNFYEREKQVAIMFGFESFECAEEPAQAGDFGYYMMRTQL